MARVSTKVPGVAITVALKKIGVGQDVLSAATGIPQAVIDGIIQGKIEVTPELSVKLDKALGEKTGHFAQLQLALKVEAAEKNAGKIMKIRKPAVKKAAAKSGAKKAGAGGKKPGRKPAAQSAKSAGMKKAGAKRGPKPKVKV